MKSPATRTRSQESHITGTKPFFSKTLGRDAKKPPFFTQVPSIAAPNVQAESAETEPKEHEEILQTAEAGRLQRAEEVRQPPRKEEPVGPTPQPIAPNARPRISGSKEPTGRSDPNALIPIEKFIQCVEDVERGHDDDTPEQILTRIRTEYYGGIAFGRLIPDAPVLKKSNWWSNPEERRLEEKSIGKSAYEHLAAQADENALGDNPSPYIVMPNGTRLDVGHLLLGLDALLHPTTGWPFSDYDVKNIDVASWVADLGIASVWMTVHEEEGKPHGDVVNPPKTPDLEAYYKKSAPLEDLLGDVDSFGLHAQRKASHGQLLSQTLKGYYLGTQTASVQQRFQIFCAANRFSYTRRGNAIAWDPTLQSRLVAEIDRFNDLYAGGHWGAVKAKFGTVERRSWPHTPKIVDRFLKWVAKNLTEELAGKP